MITDDPHKFLERFIEEIAKPKSQREPVVLVSWWPPPPMADAASDAASDAARAEADRRVVLGPIDDESEA